MDQYDGKRLAAHAFDLLLTVAASLFYSFGVIIMMGIAGIFLSKSENVNTIFIWMILLFLLPVLLGTMQFTYGASFKVKQRRIFSQQVDVLFDFSRTRGQKRHQLKVKGSQLQSFLHWFLYNGIISILVYASASASLYENSANNVFSWLTCLYAVFLLVNALLLALSSQRRSLIEKVTGTKLAEIEEI
ncbi:hypothetical protein WQ57_19510 [Mesobacillus campisalis]|uniref:Uncharacterized protein n=1 Tax=Mesobacillus campisalis TaxID=1408103 RepID=A0A0M2SRR8_9BACI|nr:hypothetical protein [Mesobacillus campisalis]KKK36371.1 hypothetical protein WQ57_19510 [Mesobacillus campisalis]